MGIGQHDDDAVPRQGVQPFPLPAYDDPSWAAVLHGGHSRKAGRVLPSAIGPVLFRDLQLPVSKHAPILTRKPYLSGRVGAPLFWKCYAFVLVFVSERGQSRG